MRDFQNFFRAEDFELTEQQYYDGNNPDEKYAAIANQLILEELERVQAVYGKRNMIWCTVQTDDDTNTAKLVDVKEIGK